MTSLHVGGLEFVADAENCVFTLAELNGWFSGPSVRLQSVERPAAHGSFSVPSYRSGRLITWSGLVFSASLYDQEKQLARLSALGGDGAPVRITVQSEDGSWWADARLADQPEIELVVPGRIASYALSFFAADPRKHGALHEWSGSSVEVFHRGTFEASPEVVVAGPRSAPYTVSCAGRQFVVSQPLGAGETHRIEMATGRVLKNDVLQFAASSRSQVFTIPPGVKRTVSISSGSMTVRVRDTSI